MSKQVSTGRNMTNDVIVKADLVNWLRNEHANLQNTTRVERAKLAAAALNHPINTNHLSYIEPRMGLVFKTKSEKEERRDKLESQVNRLVEHVHTLYINSGMRVPAELVEMLGDR